MVYGLVLFAGALAFATYIVAALQPLAVIFIRLRHIFLQAIFIILFQSIPPKSPAKPKRLKRRFLFSAPRLERCVILFCEILDCPCLRSL